MIDVELIWQLEEMAEDAIVAYLTEHIDAHKNTIDCGMSAVEYAEPGVYVIVEQSENESQDAGFTGHRASIATITIRTHANVDPDNTFDTSRRQHGKLKSLVMYHLAQSDLKDKLQLLASPTIAIDKAIIEGSSRGINTELSYHETVILLALSLRPVDEEEE